MPVVEPAGRRQAESRAAELHKQTHNGILTTRLLGTPKAHYIRFGEPLAARSG